MAVIVLPQRPLKLSRRALPGYLWLLFWAVVFAALGLFLLVWLGPGIRHDLTISRNPVPVLDGTVENAKCTTRKAIFTDCEAHISYQVDGTAYETDVALMFADFSSGGYMVNIVRSGDDPSLATFDIGIEQLWNRMIMAAVALVFTFWISAMSLRDGLQNMREARLLTRRATLQPIRVIVGKVSTSGKRTSVTSSDPAGAKAQQEFTLHFHKNEQPLILRTDRNDTYGIAVRHPDTDLPVLLERGLMRLDLSKAERAAALASVAAQQHGP